MAALPRCLGLGAIAIAGFVTAGSPAQASPIAAFSWAGVDEGGVVLVAPDGSTTQRLSPKTPHAMSEEVQVAWSPDRDRVAFHAGGEFNADIYVAKRRTKSVKRLTSSDQNDFDPSWAPGGRRLVYQRGSYEDATDAEILVVTADGSYERRLTRNDFDEENPVWSPDGTRIAFQSDKGIFTIKPNGTQRKRLTTRLFDDAPVWSPDSRFLVFVRYHDEDAHLFRIRRNGSHVRQLTFGDFHDTEPDWSGGGKRIAFVRSTGSTETVATVARGGGKVKILFSRDADRPGGRPFWPSWSPSNRRIAFAAGGSIHIIRSDGTRHRRITSNKAFFGIDW